RKPLFGEPARKCATASARADDCEVDFFVVPIFPHRSPAPEPENVGRAAAARTRDIHGVVIGPPVRPGFTVPPDGSPGRQLVLLRAWPPPLPRDRGGQSPCEHNRAGWLALPTRFHSMRSGGNNMPSQCRSTHAV